MLDSRTLAVPKRQPASGYFPMLLWKAEMLAVAWHDLLRKSKNILQMHAIYIRTKSFSCFLMKGGSMLRHGFFPRRKCFGVYAAADMLPLCCQKGEKWYKQGKTRSFFFFFLLLRALTQCLTFYISVNYSRHKMLLK